MSGSLVKGARSPDSRILMCFHRLVWKMLADEAEALLMWGCAAGRHWRCFGGAVGSVLAACTADTRVNELSARQTTVVSEFCFRAS